MSEEIEPTTAGTDALGCDELSVTFHPKGVDHEVRAVVDVTVAVRPGEVLGVIGESGSGKSTLAKALVGMQPPTSGRVFCGDIDVGATSGLAARRRLGSQISMVFQDPRSSLNPRLTIEAAIVDPLVVHRVGDRSSRHDRVMALLDDVGLPRSVAGRRVRELSGGQLQRVAIARALALSPRFVVADEPTSALDVSVQAQILNLLNELKALHGFGMLMISHDMRVMRAVTDRVAVMLNGSVVETGPTEQVFAQPESDYARELIGSTPLLGGVR